MTRKTVNDQTGYANPAGQRANKKGDPKAAFVCSSQHQRLVTESGIESMVGWFEINVLAELSSFSSASIPIHVDVFPFH